ncbi:MAG: hypothetical protein SFW66_04615 [Gammaproteobacteria bacterium]|nr:hypothetical protein [Gammaproteobacteria bacterium]
MQITIQYFIDTARALSSNHDALLELRRHYHQQMELFNKGKLSNENKLYEIIELDRKALDFSQSLTKMGDHANALVLHLAGWDQTLAEPDGSDDEDTINQYIENKKSFMRSKFPTLIKSEDALRAKAVMQSFVDIIEEVKKAGLITVPAGLNSGHTFLTEIDQYIADEKLTHVEMSENENQFQSNSPRMFG